MSAMTRAGANRHLHGSAYRYLRNDVFDARGYFDDAKLPFRRNQFGLAVGGPIIKNRTFFFANYERRRESLTTTSIATVPSPSARRRHIRERRCTSNPAVQRYLGLFALRMGWSPATPASTSFQQGRCP